MSFVASVCQPSTLRMLIWPDASNAQNNIAAVSADGSTVWVLIRRLNSSCSRSIAFVTGMRIAVPAHPAWTALVLAYGVTIRDEGHRDTSVGRPIRTMSRELALVRVRLDRDHGFQSIVIINSRAS